MRGLEAEFIGLTMGNIGGNMYRQDNEFTLQLDIDFNDDIDQLTIKAIYLDLTRNHKENDCLNYLRDRMNMATKRLVESEFLTKEDCYNWIYI